MVVLELTLALLISPLVTSAAGHPICQEFMAALDRWPLVRGISNCMHNSSCKEF